MYTDSFIIHVKTDDIYKDTADDHQTKLNTSDYDLETASPISKNKKVIGVMKDELGENIMKE